MAEEIWKEIDGFPDYHVSNIGRVKSLARIIKRTGEHDQSRKERILKPISDCSRGYLRVFLRSI